LPHRRCRCCTTVCSRNASCMTLSCLPMGTNTISRTQELRNRLGDQPRDNRGADQHEVRNKLLQTFQQGAPSAADQPRSRPETQETTGVITTGASG
jgi:predicted  nucleic acid-binding Zn-ribbon protein